MRQRPHTVAAAPYRPYCPDETTRILRQALADVEQTAVLQAVPAEGPSALRLPPHDTVTVPLWRPPVSDNAPSTTAWDDPPIALAPIQTRLWALSSCRVDEPWFREPDTATNDRSLRRFQDRWAEPSARRVVLNGHASPRTLVFSTTGFAAFDGPPRSA